MGTQNFIAWESAPRATDAIAHLRAQGYAIVALETAANATPLSEFRWPEKTALLLGNERFGLDREILAQADHLVRIPLQGQKNSLNVGIACGIALASYQNRERILGVYRSTSRHPYEARRQGERR